MKKNFVNPAMSVETVVAQSILCSSVEVKTEPIENGGVLETPGLLDF